MTSVEPQHAPACPVHNFSPYELKQLGGWTAFYDQLRAEAPEWQKIIPDYRLGEGEAIVELGRSSGMNTLPLAWDALTLFLDPRSGPQGLPWSGPTFQERKTAP